MTVGTVQQHPAAADGAERELLVRYDGSVAVVLFLIAPATRQFDIRLSQPHAPGYFLCVMLGRLVNCFSGHPHASLVWMTVVFGSAVSPLLYLLATMTFGRWAGDSR